MTLKIKPYKYQQEGIEYALTHRYCIIGDAMGLGKTVQAIGIMDRVRKGALVICPAYLRNNWKREIEKFSDLKVVDHKAKRLNSDEIAIVSYASVGKATHLNFDTVICDEIHYLKSIDAKRTEAVHLLIGSKYPSYLIGLTGTAIKNRVGEFYSLISLMCINQYDTNGFDIDDYFPNYWAFCNHFSNRKEFNIKTKWGHRKVVKYEGHRNIPHLKNLLKGKYIRRKASEVLDLPPILRKDIVYDNKDIDYELLQAWTQNNKAAFMTKKTANARIKAKLTAKYVKELMEEGQGPVVVYSEHVAPVNDIYNLLRKKYKVMEINGSTSMDKRDQAVIDFQAGKIDVIVATIGSFSTGVTLTAAKNMVFNDLSYVPAEVAQAEKRIHRIGQTSECIIHRIFYGEVDFKIGKQLDKKIETLVEVL